MIASAEPSKELIVTDEFKAQSRDFFSERIEYETVNCLLISWLESDVNTRELDRLASLFEKDLKYAALKLPLPPKNPQQFLNHQIASFVQQHSSHRRTLIIIYYAGHGDVDTEGKAQWAAYETGEPTLSWARTSQFLLDATGDVLVLLDCCHAALVDGGRKPEGKFELLAATTKGAQALMPGRFSFTTLLIQEIRKRLNRGEVVSIRDMHADLKKIAPVPDYTDLVKSGSESIYLRPLNPPEKAGFIKKPVGSLLFRASLTDDLTGLEIARWLQSYCPTAVVAVNIEHIVLKARRLQDLQELLQSGVIPRDSILHRLSESAKAEILSHMHDLQLTFSTSANSAADPNMNKDSATAQKALKDLSANVSAVSKAIETPILLGSNDPTDLNLAKSDAVVTIIEAGPSLSLRNQLLHKEALRRDLRIAHDLLKVPRNKNRFRYGTVEGKAVLVEAFVYQPDPTTAEPAAQTLRQVQKMATLLCQEKESSFRILPGVGYVQESVDSQFGLLFELRRPFNKEKPPILLSDYYNVRKRVPLGKRIELAQALVTAIEQLHRLRWLHKELRSNNVLFLRSIENADEIDIGQPWLVGFEYARTLDEGTTFDEDHSMANNLYRHPERWGKPYIAFTRAHEMYSLGVVLLEILNWKSAAQMFDTSVSSHVQSGAVRSKYTERCQRDLPHLVGQVLTDIVITCFEFDLRTKGLDEYDTQIHFQKEILNKTMNIEAGKI